MPIASMDLLNKLAETLLPVPSTVIRDTLFPGSTDAEVASAIGALLAAGRVERFVLYGNTATSGPAVYGPVAPATSIDLLLVPGSRYAWTWKARLQSH